MKRNHWKILGAIAAVAALAPVVFRKNDETGERTVDALLWQLKTRTNEETGKKDIELNILPNRLRCKVYTDVPEEELLIDAEPCDIELTLQPDLSDLEPTDPET